MNQQSLFPELDSKHLVKNIDYVDISTLPDSKWRVNSLSDIAPGTFIFYKTGYHNPATGDMRKIYPYLKSFKRKPEGVVMGYQSESKYQSDYPRYDLDFNGKAIKIYVHQLVGMCFIHNDMPELKTIVDHIDNKDILNYHPDNCRWVTPSENSKRKQ